MTFRAAVALFFVLALSQAADAQDTLVLSGIEDSVNTQIGLRVLEQAYAKLGIQLIYLPLPGERALRDANAGRVDGEVFRIANVEKRYAHLIPVPTPINVLEAIAFTKDKQITISGWESLRGYKLGIQVGIKFADRGTRGMDRILVDSNEQLFKMLYHERIDVAVMAHVNGLITLRDMHQRGIQALQPPLQRYPLYHYLHQKHQALIPRLDAVLREMQATGRMTQIREQMIKQLEREIAQSTGDKTH